MIIAVDEVIPYWRQAFSETGDVLTFSGREVGAADLRDAEALIVRSVTRVDAGLLEGTPVRFVGSASIGMDHLDTAYLDSRGIRYTNAAGSNANSVAEYVAASLLYVASRRSWNLDRKSLAVIGAGHVGSRTAQKAKALGMAVLLCDPPLRDATGDSRYLELEQVLEADILTLHVPLTADGIYPTRHMIGREVLKRLAPDAFLVNTSRGPVIDEPELKNALLRRCPAGAVLDVWENEPEIDFELLDLADLGSAHIAGFSLDGKVRGTEMILEELCRFFGLPARWNAGSVLPPPAHLQPAPGARGQAAVASVVLQAYDILKDDANIRALRGLDPSEAGAGFDRLRNRYALRPEFHHFIVELPAGEEEVAASLEGLGFRVLVPVPAANARE